ncbi:GNAT family N-acetyltransferase [Pelomonas sp. CA6]|uniref:GNAT family N-acetyltransferase n=1 Tax=Pelomonas sp. CA6 TaxID=2907999 RepID=UPI001F4C0CA7|nr:GNAT family N-acetyltransferase [Pelomonas sp. CA6]MCH7343420.1 GNAT family N-acetyltransferase [Pelomonas sp. CA6]
MSAFRFAVAATLAPSQLHAAFRAAFADYLIGPFTLDLAQWPVFLGRQGVDLALSRVALDARGQPLAFAWVAPRTGRWRLATMGALPEARGSGAAPALLDDVIARAAAAGAAAVELEVFAQNERALRLYEGRGFQTLHALHGYLAEAGTLTAGPAPDGVDAVDADAALDWLERAEARLAGLPLQVTRASLRHAQGLRALRRGGAQLAYTLPDAHSVAIASLIAPPGCEADARALVLALAADHPQRSLRVPQLQRLDLGGQVLRDLGFAPQPLHQLLMQRPL